jgi:DNA invertase Pin-like site-specific DNA recombinase
MKAVAYVRVSTAGQADDGISLDMQRERVTAYAVAQGLELVEIFEDAGWSAKTLERPGVQAALAALEERADALIVYKLDRLTRSLLDLNALLDETFAKRRRLFSVVESLDTASPMGRLVINIMASVVQWEREEGASRTSSALASKSRRGGYVGGEPPYGWRACDGSLVRDAEEQTVVAHVQSLRATGTSFRKIADRLDALGRRSRTGRRFDPTQIRRMLDPPERAFVAARLPRSAEER